MPWPVCKREDDLRRQLTSSVASHGLCLVGAGIGSLWSSICVSLIAVGVGEAVAETDCAKVRCPERPILSSELNPLSLSLSLHWRPLPSLITPAPSPSPQVLMLNGTRDRETTGMTVVDVVWAITVRGGQGHRGCVRLAGAAICS